MPPLPPAGSDGRSARTSLLIGLLCLLVYNANFRTISPGDAYPARYLPFGILRYRTLALDPIETLVRQGRGADAYWVASGRDRRAISLYPVVLPVLITPLYAPAALALRALEWPEDSLERAARIMEKATASLLAATAAALLYVLLRRRAPARDAVLLTLAFAFGTTTWVISSQALWQHGLAELLIVAALVLVTGEATPARVAAAGLAIGLVAGNRPPDALLAAAIGIHGLWWSRRRAPLLVVTAAIPAGLVLLYNLTIAGHWAGGYGVAGRAEFLNGRLVPGLAGLLASPTHGLFVFSPFLLFLPFGFRRLWSDVAHRPLTMALGTAAALQLVLYSKADWTGGESWGPRWLTDLLPILLWMLPPVVAGLRGVARLGFILACGAAIAIEAIGAFWYIGTSDAAVRRATDPLRARWSVSNTPFVVELRHRPAAMDLWGAEYRCEATGADGGVDRLLVGSREVSEIAAGEGFRVEGWTLVGGRTPWDVAIVLDGERVGSTGRFLVREDVVRAHGSPSASGWSIPARTTLPAGDHTLRVFARSCPTAMPRLVLERRVVVNRCASLDVEGSLDRLAVGGREVGEIVRDQEVRAEGWTLVGGRSPWEVAVMVDGRGVGSTRRFLPRADVARARGSASPSGWLIPIGSAGIDAGEHALTMVVRSCESAQPQVVAERRVVVSEARTAAGSGPVDLAASARRAAALLEAHQQGAGYWLTAFTSAPRFERPQEEMNTFLTATLVDLLEPVASDAGLGDSVARARRHLTAQIEADGLVRYHGLPDAPTIGRLGCEISPDADDTALVWRLAPVGRPELLRAARAALGRYRTADGLYRTWLAPRDRYQCIDPGRDPNPTDVVIQMHVWQLLARQDPAAARALCGALTRAIDEDRLWVYYDEAPLVPILRRADLERAGCALPIAAKRLQTAVPGQDAWVAASALASRAGHDSGAAEERRAVLRALAAADFAAVRRNPPLLYHNDLTGSVPRFYWSQDFGYALWLRLFFDETRRPA